MPLLSSRLNSRHLAIIVVIVMMAAAGYYFIGAQREKRKLNIVLISIDTLRSDRLGAYGYHRPTSPAIDRLAANGTLFQNVIAESSWTLPSHITMLTGLNPASHGVQDKTHRLGDRTELLSEYLRAQGYKTLGFADGGFVAGHFGFNRGFDVFDSRRFGLINRIGHAIEALEALSHQQPFFLFLHAYDVHCPYTPPEPYYSMFSTEGAKRNQLNLCIRGSKKLKGLSPNDVAYASDRYDGGIRYMDENLDQLLRYLEKRSPVDNTLIVLTSDHGEAFYEHGKIGHRDLHREVIFVPLIVSGPGVHRQIRQEPVSLADIVPSLLEVAGVPLSTTFDGSSFARALYGSAEGVYPEGNHVSLLRRSRKLSSLVSFPFHFIINERNREMLLYDLVRDPREQFNLAQRHPEVLEALQTKLATTMKNFRPGEAVRSERLDKGKLKELRSLGYVR